MCCNQSLAVSFATPVPQLLLRRRCRYGIVVLPGSCMLCMKLWAAAALQPFSAVLLCVSWHSMCVLQYSKVRQVGGRVLDVQAHGIRVNNGSLPLSCVMWKKVCSAVRYVYVQVEVAFSYCLCYCTCTGVLLSWNACGL
eukprot:scpid105675/ scgid21607/ 